MILKMTKYILYVFTSLFPLMFPFNSHSSLFIRYSVIVNLSRIEKLKHIIKIYIEWYGRSHCWKQCLKWLCVSWMCYGNILSNSTAGCSFFNSHSSNCQKIYDGKLWVDISLGKLNCIYYFPFFVRFTISKL